MIEEEVCCLRFEDAKRCRNPKCKLRKIILDNISKALDEFENSKVSGGKDE